MRTARWLPVVLVAAGCYDPKADIDAFRPQAEKRIAAMERLGKAVAALPRVGPGDAVRFPDAKKLNFGEHANAALIHLEELSDVGGSKIYDRIVEDEFWKPAVTLLKTGRDPFVSKLNKELVGERFHQFLDVEYLVVVRTLAKKQAEMVDKNTFAAGAFVADVFVCEVETAACHGGFTVGDTSSDAVSARVHDKRADTDKSLAVRADLDKKILAQLHEKTKAALPGASFPSYW